MRIIGREMERRGAEGAGQSPRHPEEGGVPWAGVLLLLVRIPLNPGPALQGWVRAGPGQSAPQRLCVLGQVNLNLQGPPRKPGPSPRTIRI